MTLLQTRVDDQVAKRFEKVAHRQGKSPYALLADLVRRTAGATNDTGWETHRSTMPQRPALRFNACVKARLSEDR